MLLKCVSSYVTKMHEAATSEGLYCTNLTGFQAANSFLRTVHPLAPEMIFQLSSFKAAWTDKLTRQFTPPHPGQEKDNLLYRLYLAREPTDEDLSLLQWLRSHTVAGKKAKALGADKFLVAVKFVSVHNPVFFYQHLVVHHPHRTATQLQHLEEASMPVPVRFFSQAVALCPHNWTTSDQILRQFEFEGHRSSYLTTVVAFVHALHDILFLWQRRVVDGRIGSLQARTIERLYPLSPFQTAVYRDIVDSLAQRKSFLDRRSSSSSSSISSASISSPSISSASCSWSKYRVLLGKPGTGKSQVLIRAIHTALQQEYKVLMAAPVALLAQGYRAIFGSDLVCDTLHAAFHIPVDGQQSGDVNYSLNRYDLVVVNEASLVSPQSFAIVAATLNKLNRRPSPSKYEKVCSREGQGNLYCPACIFKCNRFTLWTT